MDQPTQWRSLCAWISVVVVSVAFAACSRAPIPSVSTRALGAGEQWLRSIPPTGLCAGGGATAIIRLSGSRADPRVAWMTLPDGTTRQLSWRPGTSARFVPTLEVIGPDGTVVAREGSVITASCTIAPDFELAEFGESPLASSAASLPTLR